MGDGARFAGHRLIKFSATTTATLKDIADRLIPHEKEILDGWVSRQLHAWEPPGFDRAGLGEVFANVLGSILHNLHSGELDACIDSLEQAGSDLAARQFPFDALVITVHFLEESYIRYLLNPAPQNPRKWLVTMDEFLHVALAAIANAYFEAYRAEILEQAEVGRIVQEGLLGHIPKKAADLEIAHAYIPAQEQAQLGGDFLDTFRIGSGLMFFIGDLSGHGVAAAADSVMLRSLFRGFLREHADLSNAMERLNHVVGSELDSSHFATALAASYDSTTGIIQLVNAGHPFPVVCDDSCRLIEAHGTALAIGFESEYSVTEVELKPGGLFVAYTDGLIEARAAGKGIYGDDRLLEAVSDIRDAPAWAVAEQLIDNARRHAEGKFSDDVALLVLRRKNTKGLD